MAACSVSRPRADVVRAAGSGAAWGIGAGAVSGIASLSYVLYSSLPLLGAACDWSDGIAGTSSVVRGFACLGVGSGGGGGGGDGRGGDGGGGGCGRAPAASRALSSSIDDGGGGGSSSPDDKLAAKRAAREKMKPPWGKGVGDREAGGAARGARGGSGAGARGGGRGGGGGRGHGECHCVERPHLA